MRHARFDLYQDKKGEWRWRLLAGNGRTVADSGEGYVRKSGALAAIERLRRLATVAPMPTDSPFVLPVNTDHKTAQQMAEMISRHGVKAKGRVIN